MDPRFEEAQELVSSLKTKCQLRKEKMLRKQRENGNNNDDNYENSYNDHHHRRQFRSSSGRLSNNSASNSNESAFSSPSASGSETEDSGELSGEDQSLSSASTSGRSSASRSVGSAGELSTAKQLNTVCNLTPGGEFARGLIEQVRRKFLESLRSDAADKYEEADLVELQTDPDQHQDGHQEQALSSRLISRFINFKLLKEMWEHERADELDKALEEAVGKLREFLQFRHRYQLTLVLDDHFSKEIHMLHGIFPFGRDKNQLPVLYLRARVHRRWSRELDESFRRYVAWQVNLLTKSYAGAQVEQTIGTNAIEKDGSFGICFDCLNVSYACVDMDFLSYLVKILVNYYPTYCRYALCVDLPWLFRSVWKIVRSWLPEDARNTVHLITSKQLTEFIDEGQIPNSIKVNDLKAHEKPAHLKHKLPENSETLKSVEQVAKDLSLSSSEIKQFKAHVEKIRKEYEQLGAI